MTENCRICLNTIVDTATSITEQLLSYLDLPIYQILNLIGELDEDLQISADDGFSQRICSSCYTTTKTAAEFIVMDTTVSHCTSGSDGEDNDNESNITHDLDTIELKLELKLDDDEPPSKAPPTRGKTLKEMSKINVVSQKAKGGRAYCEICDHTYCSAQELKRHRDRVHVAEKPFTCDIDGCGKTFAAEYLVVRHKRETHLISAGVMRKRSNVLGRPEDVTCCCMCDFEIESPEELEEHVKSCHPDPEKKKFPGECIFECQYCFKKFQKKGSFYRHFADKNFEETVVKRKQMRIKNRVPCICQECGKNFAGKNDLYIHRQRVHPTETPFKCTFEGCQAAYALQSFLNAHLKDHESERMYVCEICAASFTRQKYLKKHMDVHDAGKDIKCPMCRLYFKTESLLEKHIKRHNSKFTRKINPRRLKVWDHECKQCGKMFSHQGFMKMHNKFCGRSSEKKDGAGVETPVIESTEIKGEEEIQL